MQQDHEPSRDEIARLAYGIWEAESHPLGRDVAHWLLAEQQLRAGRDGEARLSPADVPQPGQAMRARRRNRASRAEANV